MKKKSFRKNKGILALSLALGLVAVTSSAFAAYVITGGTLTNGEAPTPEIEVVNKVIDVTVTPTGDPLAFYPAAGTNGNLTVDEKTPGNLDLDVKLTATTNNIDNLKGKTYTVTLALGDKTEGTASNIANFLVAPAVKEVKGETFVAVAGSENTFESTATMDPFTWGTEFDNKSPLEWATDKTPDVIEAKLTAFNNALKAAKITITLGEK